MTRTLLILLLLIQLVICYVTYRQEKYIEALFAVVYLGVDKSEQLAAYVKLRDKVYIQKGIFNDLLHAEFNHERQGR